VTKVFKKSFPVGQGNYFTHHTPRRLQLFDPRAFGSWLRPPHCFTRRSSRG